MTGANVVRDYRIGLAQIKIADNYYTNSACEVDEILQDIAEQAQRQFVAFATAKKYGQKENAELSARYR